MQKEFFQKSINQCYYFIDEIVNKDEKEILDSNDFQVIKSFLDENEISRIYIPYINKLKEFDFNYIEYRLSLADVTKNEEDFWDFYSSSIAANDLKIKREVISSLDNEVCMNSSLEWKNKIVSVCYSCFNNEEIIGIDGFD